MDNKFKETSEKLVPKQDIIEFAVSFYGEQYREQITKNINELGVVLVTKDELGYIVKSMFKEKYQDKTKDWEQMAENFIINLNNLGNNFGLVDATMLARDAKVLAELGFDVKKIIRKNEIGLFEFIQGPETERLKMYIQTMNIDKKAKGPLEDYIDNYVKAYNICAENKKLYSSDSFRDINAKKSKIYNPNVRLTFASECIDIQKEYNNIDIPKMPEELTKEDKKFLNDLFMSKGPVSLWSDSFAEYIVKGINRIFNKNYTSIKEVVNDKSMELLFNFKDNLTNARVEEIKQDNKLNSKKYSDKKEIIHRSYIRDFFNDETAAAEYYPQHVIMIGIDDEYSLHDVLHEVNHALSANTFWEDDNLSDLRKVGFKHGANKDHDEGFNEIVNEFLTNKLQEKIPKDYMESKSLKSTTDYQYTAGIELLEKFLNKFENKLKECQMGDADEVLKNFIGERNYNLVISYGAIISKLAYGNMNFPFNQRFNISQPILKASDWVAFHKAGKDKGFQYIDSEINTLQIFLSIEKFFERLAENYAEFEKGNIIDIPIEHVKVETNENALTVTD